MIELTDLKSQLDYSESTGVFTWIKPSNLRLKKGMVAGSINGRGYHDIYISGKHYLSHRLAWLYVNGGWPKGNIDHKNGIKTDNKIGNLRDVNQLTNGKNRRMHSNNSSVFNGVSWNKPQRKWHVRICVDNKSIYIGDFSTIVDAVIARKKANIKYEFYTSHGEKNNA